MSGRAWAGVGDAAVDAGTGEAVVVGVPGGASIPSLAQEELAERVRLGDVEGVGSAVLRGADVNFADFLHDGGKRPLHVAVLGGWRSVVASLVSFGADPNLGDAGGRTALWLATRRGDLEMVRFLLEEVGKPWLDPHSHPDNLVRGGGTDLRVFVSIDQPCHTTLYTPLHLAARANHLPLTALLLHHGASPTRRNAAGETPLHLAAARGFHSVCAALIKGGGGGGGEEERGRRGSGGGREERGESGGGERKSGGGGGERRSGGIERIGGGERRGVGTESVGVGTESKGGGRVVGVDGVDGSVDGSGGKFDWDSVDELESVVSVRLGAFEERFEGERKLRERWKRERKRGVGEEGLALGLGVREWEEGGEVEVRFPSTQRLPSLRGSRRDELLDARTVVVGGSAAGYAAMGGHVRTARMLLAAQRKSVFAAEERRGGGVVDLARRQGHTIAAEMLRDGEEEARRKWELERRKAQERLDAIEALRREREELREKRERRERQKQAIVAHRKRDKAFMKRAEQRRRQIAREIKDDIKRRNKAKAEAQRGKKRGEGGRGVDT